ncbi:TPA: hypothetical protein ACNV1G_002142 [Citrobacter amalonaticus]
MLNKSLPLPVSPRVVLLPELLVILLLSGCGDREERDFIRGCKSGGYSTALCGCIWDELQKIYVNGELQQTSQDGRLPPGFINNMQKAGLQCSKKFNR